MRIIGKILNCVTKHAEPIKIVFAVVGAAYILVLYFEAKQEATIRRAIDYSNRFQSGSLFEVRAEIDKTWMEPENLSVLRESVETGNPTLPTQRATQLLASDVAFRKNVIQLIDFYSSISGCALQDQCDLETVCLLFGNRMKNARVLYGEYFADISVAFRNDILATLTNIDDKCVEENLVEPW